MGKIQIKDQLAVAVCLVLTSPLSWAAAAAADDNTPDMDLVTTQLRQARDILLTAEKTAEEIIREAQAEAEKVRTRRNQATAEGLAPLMLQNSKISIEIAAGTIKEIVKAIMPKEWRILVDVKNKALTQRRFQFVSTRTREQALNDLLNPIGMKHQYFFDLKDSEGRASPLLVVSVER